MDEDFAFDYGNDFTGYDFGNSGYEEPVNYQPAGYQNPAWDNPEHYAYEPPPAGNYNEGASTDISGGNSSNSNLFDGLDPQKKGGDMSMLGQYGSGGEKKSSLSDSLGGSRGGGEEGSLRRYLVGSSTTSTQIKKFNRALPEFSGPTLTMPTWDEEKLKRLRQSKANYGVSSLRDIANRAITSSRSAQTGYAARQSLRDAMSGYGKGLSSVMKEAEANAESEYGKEFTAEAQKAQQEYNARFQVANIMYQAALQAYLNDFTITNQSVTSNQYA